MNRLVRIILAFCLPLMLAAVTKKPTKKPSAKHPVTHGKTSGHTVKPRGKVARGKSAHARPGKTHSAPVQHSQAAPTSDRYREIQQALVEKGYLKSEPTGIWDADTQDAMRRFQSDQNLDKTGKINSLSLISLGLGPKH